MKKDEVINKLRKIRAINLSDGAYNDAIDYAVQTVREEPEQPDVCIYGGSCCWPIARCYECPNHEAEKETRTVNITGGKVNFNFKEGIRMSQTSWMPLDDTGYEPLFRDDYLVTFDDGYVAVVHYDGSDWELWADSGEPIAWMYVPAPYQRGGWEDGKQE